MNVTEQAPETKKLSKAEKKQQKANALQTKRMQQLVEKRQRLLNQGVPEAEVDQRLQQEAYNALSPDAKIARLEQMVAQAVRGLAGDLQVVFQNQNMLAQSVDLKERAYAKAFEKLGIDPEQQQALLDQAQTELVAEYEARAKQQSENVLVKDLQATGFDGNGSPVDEDAAPAIPDGATVFGG